MRRLVVVLLAVLLPGAAFAQVSSNLESDRSWVLELNGGKFHPSIDQEPGLTGQPYRDIFGKRSMWLFGAELDYELFQGFGTLSAGLATSYGSIYGHGIITENGQVAPDLTALHTIPVRALAVYRFDWLSRELGIPLIPFGKAGLAYTFWWVTGANGVPSFSSGKGRGGKWGYQLSAGLALDLNVFDRATAREFDEDFGVNSVFIFGEYTRLTADNFGGKGMDLSDDAWMFGLGFEF